MKIKYSIILMLAIVQLSLANDNSRKKENDSIKIERRLSDIEHKIKVIDSNQLNYRIEKDLLKETYSNNYQKISLVITLILGIMSILAYLGLKDIGSVKKEYIAELDNLKKIKSLFDLKTIEIDTRKKEIDKELKFIIQENQEQSKKIKFIELKEKIENFLKEDNLTSALEFINAALGIYPDNTDILTFKGRVLCRLNNLPEALISYNKAHSLSPENPVTSFNLVECLYFSNKIDDAKSIISNNKALFDKKEEGNLLKFFDIIELYHKSNIEGLLDLAKTYVNKENLKLTNPIMKNWDLKETLYFIHYKKDNDLKIIFQNIVWFWDGQLNGETLLKRLKIELPE